MTQKTPAAQIFSSTHIPANPGEPLYQVLKNLIIQALKEKRLKPGDQLPGELELTAHFGLSQGTVRRAVLELCHAGVLYKQQGRGTFVSNASTSSGTSLERLAYLHPDDSDRGRSTARLTKFERIRAEPRIARMLGLLHNEDVFHLRRRHYLENSPQVFGFDDIYLPMDRFAGLTETLLAQHPETRYGLYPFYEQQFGITVVSTDDTIRAALLNKRQAAAAGVPIPYPAVTLQRISYTFGSAPFEARIMTSITDHIGLRIRTGL